MLTLTVLEVQEAVGRVAAARAGRSGAGGVRGCDLRERNLLPVRVIRIGDHARTFSSGTVRECEHENTLRYHATFYQSENYPVTDLIEKMKS